MALLKLAKMALGSALIVIGVAGCTSTSGGYFRAASSINTLELSEPTAVAIAGDMAGQIAQHVGPGTATIALRSDGSTMSVALEDSLRAHGFAIDPFAASDDGFALAYTVTGHSEEIFVRISTPTLEVARAYAAAPTGVEPLTPISIMRHAAS